MERQERRRHPRLPLHLPVTFGPTETSAPADQTGCTVNIAAGGLRMTAEGNCPPVGQHLKLWLDVPAGAGASPLGGKVQAQATVLRTAATERADRWDVVASFDQTPRVEFAT